MKPGVSPKSVGTQRGPRSDLPPTGQRALGFRVALGFSGLGSSGLGSSGLGSSGLGSSGLGFSGLGSSSVGFIGFRAAYTAGCLET